MKRLEKLSDVIGLTVEKIIGGDVGDNEIVFLFTTGEVVILYHMQDCCENVSVADVDGDIQDLVGGIVTEFEDVSSDAEKAWHDDREMDSYTWTFYKFATTKGFVNIRWLGESNGYYSERVDVRLESDGDVVHL